MGAAVSVYSEKYAMSTTLSAHQPIDVQPSQYGSRANNRVMSTATVLDDCQRRLARQQRQRIRVGNSCVLAASRQKKARLAQLYIKCDQQSESISGTAEPMKVAYPHSRVSAKAVYPHQYRH